MKDYRLEGETVVIRVSDGASFSIGATGNSDWEEYSQWLKKGNTPDPYVEPELGYQDKRLMAYASIGDQLDMLWHAIDDETLDKTSDFYTSLKATKDKYPKE